MRSIVDIARTHIAHHRNISLRGGLGSGGVVRTKHTNTVLKHINTWHSKLNWVIGCQLVHEAAQRCKKPLDHFARLGPTNTYSSAQAHHKRLLIISLTRVPPTSSSAQAHHSSSFTSKIPELLYGTHNPLKPLDRFAHSGLTIHFSLLIPHRGAGHTTACVL